jgi:5'(3')-deoxyribonucleotidase
VKIFVDLDGVLADLNQRMATLVKIEIPHGAILSHGHDWIVKTTGMSDAEFFKVIQEDVGFYRKLNPFPWAGELIEIVNGVDKDWSILTAALWTLPETFGDKAIWVGEKLGSENVKRMIVVGSSSEKRHLAKKDSVLIDDFEDNVDAWRSNGGIAFRWQPCTADSTEYYMSQLGQLRNFLK